MHCREKLPATRVSPYRIADRYKSPGEDKFQVEVVIRKRLFGEWLPLSIDN